MKLYHVVLNALNMKDIFWNKKGEYAVFFEIAKSKIEVKEKFKLFEHVVIISIV
ncbi:hypothetical protein [Providencia rettgeri]